MLEKITRWCIFSVALSLIPLIAGWLAIGLDNTANQPSGLSSLIGRGELLLLTSGLCAKGAGELFGTGSNMATLKIVAGGMSMILLLLTAIYFAHVSTSFANGSPQNVKNICDISLKLFGFSLISSLSCIILSKV